MELRLSIARCENKNCNVTTLYYGEKPKYCCSLCKELVEKSGSATFGRVGLRKKEFRGLTKFEREQYLNSSHLLVNGWESA